MRITSITKRLIAGLILAGITLSAQANLLSTQPVSQIWVENIDIALSRDDDNDRFYTDATLRLSLSSDSAAGIYARIYSTSGNPFYELLFETDVQYLNGFQSAELLFWQLQFDQGMPAQYTNFRVDLYDAYDRRLIYVIDDATYPSLRNIPLESREYDEISVQIQGSFISANYTGGSISLAMYLILFLIGIHRKF